MSDPTGQPSIVYLPPAMYDEAAALGIDMKGFAKTEPIPVTGLDYGKLEARVLAHSNAPRWPDCPGTGRVVRKHVSERTCHGKDVACLPGLNGKCVACFDDD